MVDIQSLPTKIKSLPHWRLLLRPAEHRQRISDAKYAKTLVRENAVMLRGWDFPHLSREQEEQILEEAYLASGADFLGTIEYWRLYFSGQFLHLHAVREHTEVDWREKLKKQALQCMRAEREKAEKAPGFLSILNMVYTYTEFFEFANRLASKKLYDGILEIHVTLANIKGFSLIAEYPKHWWAFYPATVNEISKVWRIEPELLVGDCHKLAIDGSAYFLERFGWDKVPVDILREDQSKLLSGRF